MAEDAHNEGGLGDQGQNHTEGMEDEEPQRKRRRESQPPAIACLNCRSAKCKCVMSDPTRVRCDRCTKGGLECLFVKHQRGRKFGTAKASSAHDARAYPRPQSFSPTPAATTPSLLPNDTSSFSLQAILRPSIQSPPEDSPASPSSSHGAGLPNASSTPRRGQSDGVAAGIAPSWTGQRQGGHVIGGPQSGKPFSVAERGWNDPITLGIMTEKAAVELCSFYFTHLNILTSLLDPALNELPVLRSRSAFLFTAVITCASRFHRTEYNTRCRTLLRQHAARSFDENIRNVDTVQAFMLMTNWKHSKDDRSWTYLGYALRMSMEIGLDKPRRVMSGGGVKNGISRMDELERRENMNRERTWLSHASEQSLCSLIDKTPMCNDHTLLVSKSAKWHRDVLAMPSDTILAGFVQLRFSAAKMRSMLDAFSSKSLPDKDLTVFYLAVNRDINDWANHWLNEMDSDTFKMYIPLVKFYGNHIKLWLNSFAMRDPSKATPMNLSDCFSAATKGLEAVLEMEKHGLLRYVQDNANVMSSYAAVKLMRMITSEPLANTASAESSVELVLTVSRAFARASRGANDTALLQSQFLAGLVHDANKARQKTPERAVPVPLPLSTSHIPEQPLPSDYLDPNAYLNQRFQADAFPGTDAYSLSDVGAYMAAPSQEQVPPAMVQEEELQGLGEVTEDDAAMYLNNMWAALGMSQGDPPGDYQGEWSYDTFS